MRFFCFFSRLRALPKNTRRMPAAYALRRWPYLAPLPTIIANVVIVTPVLVWVYHVDTVWYLAAAGVALGEIVCCGVLGSVLTVALRNRKLFLKK